MLTKAYLFHVYVLPPLSNRTDINAFGVELVLHK